MEAGLLFGKGIGKPRTDGANGDQASEVHIYHCSGKAAHYQAKAQGGNPISNKLAFESAVNKGLLEPLVH